MYPSMPTSLAPLGIQREPISVTVRSIRLIPSWPDRPSFEIVFGPFALGRRRRDTARFYGHVVEEVHGRRSIECTGSPNHSQRSARRDDFGRAFAARVMRDMHI